jgi:tRNA (cmo5U34)-methyltransferase
MSVNRWPDVDHALAYLRKAGTIPHRTEGEEMLLGLLPEAPTRVLDIGTGDGRLLALVRTARPGVPGIGLDFSPPMLERARERFASDDDITIVEHDLDEPLPDLGRFDLVVSSFAIHHVEDRRKAALYREVFERLEPGGLFANLEHVASPTEELHVEFLHAIDSSPEHDDPSNKLAPVEAQLQWLRDAGFQQVDCFWKWRELALLAGMKPR